MRRPAVGRGHCSAGPAVAAAAAAAAAEEGSHCCSGCSGCSFAPASSCAPGAAMSNNSTSLRQTFGTMVGEVTFGRNSRTQSVARIRARVGGRGVAGK